MKTKKKFDYREIKTFENACAVEKIDPLLLPDVSMLPEPFRKLIIAAYKLHVVFKAINQEWRPDWSNWDELKYYPWFKVLSSGFGFSYSSYHYDSTDTDVGSRLCTNSAEKALHIAKYFEAEYKEYFLYSE